MHQRRIFDSARNKLIKINSTNVINRESMTYVLIKFHDFIRNQRVFLFSLLRKL